jgi:hypothetical protein
MPYNFEGNPITVEHEPKLNDGTLWVPLRSLASAMGGSADWDPDNKVAIVYFSDKIVTLKIGDPNVDINGTPLRLQEAPYVEDGDTWVPVRFFSDGLRFSIDVDTVTKSVSIFTSA